MKKISNEEQAHLNAQEFIKNHPKVKIINVPKITKLEEGKDDLSKR